MKKLLFFSVFLYILAVLQTGLFAHFAIKWFTINFIMIFCAIFNILEDPRKNGGFWLAIIGGFFLDIFSTNFLGFHIIFLMLLALLTKIFLRRYFNLSIKLR